MRTKLFLILLFISSYTFAQFPTNGLLAEYSFTSGSLSDGANGNNFTQQGTTLTNVNDRYQTSSNAISLNNDYLRRTNINFTDLSYSFWIKTSTNDSNYKTIIDDSSRTSDTFAHLEKRILYIFKRW